jgi:glycosyltransferase involved in cell wall biosynthesis
MLHYLSARHEVTLLAPEPGPGQVPPPPDSRFRVEAYKLHRGPSFLSGFVRALLKNLPLQSGLFYQPDLGRRLRELAPAADLGILQLVRLAIHLEDFGRVPLLVDLIDSLSLSFSLRADIDRWWMRLPLRLEAHLLALWERRLIERAAKVVVVCERDRQALANRLPRNLAEKISVVRVAVRERRIEPSDTDELMRILREAETPVLTLTGNLGYFVNVDAVTWWLANVWPVLRNARPGISVVVAGDRPARAVRRAIKEAGAGVRLIESPPDLRFILRQATLALAPMRCGAGVPIKVLEAWTCGVPVVASPWAVAGTSGRQGEDFRVVGQHPIEWVGAISELLDDPIQCEKLAASGRRRLAADYSRETVREQLLAVVASLEPAG